MKSKTELRHAIGLLTPQPIVGLIETWRRELEIDQRRTPASERVVLLKSYLLELEQALDESRNLNVWISIEQLSTITCKPQSTLRRICARGAEVGASKIGNTWSIHWPTFERVVMHSSPSANWRAA